MKRSRGTTPKGFHTRVVEDRTKYNRAREKEMLNLAPIARESDSDGSHVAAHEHTVSGRRTANKMHILDYVAYNPGLTSKEIALGMGMGRHEVGRRLPDLREDGLVRSERRSGAQLRWWAVAKSE